MLVVGAAQVWTVALRLGPPHDAVGVGPVLTGVVVGGELEGDTPRLVKSVVAHKALAAPIVVPAGRNRGGRCSCGWRRRRGRVLRVLLSLWLLQLVLMPLALARLRLLLKVLPRLLLALLVLVLLLLLLLLVTTLLLLL
jgi:hypothetical protein